MAKQTSLWPELETQPKKYLWIRLTDIDELGTIGPLGSPINLMIRDDLGDRLVGTVMARKGEIDEAYIIIEATEERIEAIKDGLDLIGEKKLGRRIRTKVTKKLPQNDDKWTWIK